MKNKFVKTNYLIVFFLSFFIRIFGFVLNGKMSLIADEMGMLLPAASLAGRDWSGITPLFDYYGFGYSVLFIPIFLITNNPYVIYWSIMVIGAAVLSLATVIGYHMLKEYLNVKDDLYAGFTSFSCLMLALTDMRYINNEPMIVLICYTFLWLILLLIKFDNDRIRKKKYTILIFLLLSYALTVHNRLIVIWAAFFLLILIYYILYKQTLISLKIGLPLGMCCFGGCYHLISFVSSYFWIEDENGFLRNSINSTTNTMTSNIIEIFDPNNWNATLNILIGNIFTINFFTCGIMIFAQIILFKYIETHFYHSSTFTGEIKSSLIVNRMIETGSTMFFLTFIITIAGLMVQWGPLASKGMDLGYDANTMSTKIFVYIRYYSSYASATVLLFLAFVYHNRHVLKRYMTHACILFTFVFIYWFIKIVPYIRSSSIGLTVFGSYGFYTTDNTITSGKLYIFCGFLILILFIVVCISYKKEKIIIPIFLMFLLITYRYYYNSAFLQSSGEHKATGGYQFIKEIEENIELPTTLYISAYTSYYYSYQFLLNDYKIVQIDTFPEEFDSGIIITMDMEDQALRYEKGFKCVQMDKYAYMWVKGPELQKQMTEYGVDFYKQANSSY